MRWLLAACIALSVVACGGGGGSSPDPIPDTWNLFRTNRLRLGRGGGSIANNFGNLRQVRVDDPNSPASPISSSPLIGTNNTIYIGSEGGTIRAVNGDDLTTHWSLRSCGATDPAPPLGSIVATPALFEQFTGTTLAVSTIIAASRSGRMYLIAVDEAAVVDPPPCTAIESTVFNVAAEYGPEATLEFVSSPTFTIAPSTSELATIVIGARIHVPARGGQPARTVGKLYTLNGNGTLRWQYPARGEEDIAGISSSPTLVFNSTLLVFSDDGTLHTVTVDGQFKRRTSFPGLVTPGVFLAPTVAASSAVFFAGADGSLYAINHDGSQRWVRRFVGESFSNSVVIGTQDLVPETPVPTEPSTAVGTGTPTVTHTPTPTETPTPSVEPTNTPSATPARQTSNVFAISNAGRMIYVDEQTGADVPPSGTPVPVNGDVPGSPVMSGDLFLVFGTSQGILYAINSASLLPPKHCVGGTLSGQLCVFDADCAASDKDDVDGVCRSYWPIPVLGNCTGTPPASCRSDEECGTGRSCLRSPVRSSPAIGDDGTIWFGADDGYLYGVGAEGTPMPGASTPTPTPTVKS